VSSKRETGVYVGMGANAQFATTMIPRGVDWVQVGNDYEYIINGIDATIASIRAANG
jgi:hypothetical protein